MSAAFSSRPGTLAGINARVEMHGEEPTPAMDVTLAMMLTPAEVNQLKGPHTAESWFETRDGRLFEPSVKDLHAFKQKGKFAASHCAIVVGVNSERFELNGTAAGISYALQVGGMTHVKFKMQTLITSENVELFLHMGREIDLEVSFGELKREEDQKELEFEPPKPKDPQLKAVGTPEQEREKAHERERQIAQEIERQRETE